MPTNTQRPQQRAPLFPHTPSPEAHRQTLIGELGIAKPAPSRTTRREQQRAAEAAASGLPDESAMDEDDGGGAPAAAGGGVDAEDEPVAVGGCVCVCGGGLWNGMDLVVVGLASGLVVGLAVGLGWTWLLDWLLHWLLIGCWVGCWTMIDLVDHSKAFWISRVFCGAECDGVLQYRTGQWDSRWWAAYVMLAALWWAASVALAHFCGPQVSHSRTLVGRKCRTRALWWAASVALAHFDGPQVSRRAGNVLARLAFFVVWGAGGRVCVRVSQRDHLYVDVHACITCVVGADVRRRPTPMNFRSQRTSFHC
eukprot:363319-Chlamydomonas_euryale.AAC.4